jgi:hypothetical protein
MTLADYAQTTLKGAQANAVAAVTSQIVDLNNNLKSNYLTAFNNRLNNWTAARIADRSTAPKPRNGYVLGYFDDPTTGPGSLGPYGDMVVQWAYPAAGTQPVCEMPPIPEIPKPFVPPVLPEPANIRNVPVGDTMPVGYQLLAPDGGKWQKQASPTPFGMAYYYAKLG